MIWPSPSDRSVPPCRGVGHNLVNVVRSEYVGKVAVFAVSALFAATTYSTFLLAEIRLKAKTPGPVSAYRVTWAPSASVGCFSRSFESAAMCWYSGCLVSKLAAAVVASVPIRSLSLYDATRDGNMSSRASWSPPSPVKPCSSP